MKKFKPFFSEAFQIETLLRWSSLSFSFHTEDTVNICCYHYKQMIFQHHTMVLMKSSISNSDICGSAWFFVLFHVLRRIWSGKCVKHIHLNCAITSLTGTQNTRQNDEKDPLPLIVICPVVWGTPTRVTGYKPDSAGRERAAGRDSNSTPVVKRPWKKVVQYG